MSLALVTARGVHLWIGARTVELAARRAPMRGMAVAALGPDVLAGDFDGRQAASRIAVHDVRAIGEVLLDQRIAAGIGNIYKSEALFVRGVDPRRPVDTLSEDELAAIYDTARELMRANLGPGRRTTTAGDRLGARTGIGERYFVYSRTGRPCTRCQTAIEIYRQGDPPRWTWSCPRCQPAGGRTAPCR